MRYLTIFYLSCISLVSTFYNSSLTNILRDSSFIICNIIIFYVLMSSKYHYTTFCIQSLHQQPILKTRPCSNLEAGLKPVLFKLNHSLSILFECIRGACLKFSTNNDFKFCILQLQLFLCFLFIFPDYYCWHSNLCNSVCKFHNND